MTSSALLRPGIYDAKRDAPRFVRPVPGPALETKKLALLVNYGVVSATYGLFFSLKKKKKKKILLYCIE